MTWWTVGAAAVSAVASIAGGVTGSKSASGAARAGARAESKVTSAKIEDLYKEERVLKGTTIARTAASGVKYDPETSTSSPMEVLMEQAKNFERERRIVSEVGATKAAQGLQRGKMAGDAAMYGGVAQGASTLASAFSMIAARN